MPTNEAEALAHATSAILFELAEQIADRIIARLPDPVPPSSPWLDFGEACDYLRLSRDSLYKLTAARAIPTRKKVDGQGLRFHRDELDAWIESHYPRLDRLR